MSDERNHNILLFTNSELEFNYIQQTLSGVKSLDERRAECYMNSKKFLILRSDPGIFSASYYLTRELTLKNYELVINAGICGTYNQKLNIGSAVRVESEFFADTGAEDGKTLFDLGLMNKDAFPFQNGKLHDNPGNIKGLDDILPAVKAVTVNRISQTNMNISFIMTKYRPDIESMEGAAVFYICANEGLNYIQIRGISNVVGDRDQDNWEVGKAMKSVGEAIVSIFR
ncbi:MAG: futalosine hydrolase [Bacteroidota bacterium]